MKTLLVEEMLERFDKEFLDKIEHGFECDGCCIEGQSDKLKSFLTSELSRFSDLLVEELKKKKPKCTCGCNFKDGCLCLGDRKVFNQLRSDLLDLIEK